MNKSYKIEVIEALLYGVIWMGVFSIPFFSQWGFSSLDWEKLFSEWLRISGFFVVFLLNILVLIPRFLIAQKYKIYLISAVALIAGITGIGLLLNELLFPQPLTMPPMNLGSGIPMELGSGMPAPIGFKPARRIGNDSLSLLVFANVIISILVVGSSTTFKVIGQWLIAEDRRRDMEKEQLRNELVFLRHQVSPHFFMNTLNNIHSLVDINSEDAKDAIIRLSTMMRYLLYETSQGFTTLRKEVGFIESYISLMQLRYSENVRVTVELPKRIPEVMVPPMLFISLIENAFKHGVSYQHESYVSFRLEISGQTVDCTIKNSRHSQNSETGNRYSGIGLTNIRKSLELLYGKNYAFDITETEHEYCVHLSIPIEENTG